MRTSWHHQTAFILILGILVGSFWFVLSLFDYSPSLQPRSDAPVAHAAPLTLQPISDVEYSSPTYNWGGCASSGFCYNTVNDDPDSSQPSTRILTDPAGDGNYIVFELSDVPAGFDGMNSLTVDAYTGYHNVTDDTQQFFAQVFASDGTTALTDRVKIAEDTGGNQMVGYQSIPFTSVSSSDEATWNGAVLKIDHVYSNNMSGDDARMGLDAIELDGDYSSAYPPHLTQSGYRFFENFDNAELTGETWANDGYRMKGFAISGDYMYLSGRLNSGGTAQSRTEKRSLDGGLVWQADASEGTSTRPEAMVTDGTYLYNAGSYWVGNTPYYWIEKRLMSTGALDSGFGSGGSLTTSSAETAGGIAYDNGYIYIGGETSAEDFYMEKRSATDGSIVWSTTTAAILNSGEITDVAVDGSYVYFVGKERDASNRQYWHIEKRALSDGSLDNGFDGDGIVQELSTANVEANIYDIETDGTYMYLMGYHEASTGNTEWRIQKRNLSNGSPQWTKTTDFYSSYNDKGFKLDLGTSTLYVVGTKDTGSGLSWRIEERAMSTGDLVTSFGTGGGTDISQAECTSWSACDVRGFELVNGNFYIVGTGWQDSAYYWHTQMADSSDGTAQGATPLAATNTPATLSSSGQAFRLRNLIHVATSSLSEGDFSLQYAGKGGGTCASPAGTPGTYTDVTTSTLIAYYDNTGAINGAAISAYSEDPYHSTDTSTMQTYVEQNTFSVTSTVSMGYDGMWDFALYDNSAATSNTTYCFRVASSSSPLDAYTYYPEVTVLAVPVATPIPFVSYITETGGDYNGLIAWESAMTSGGLDLGSDATKVFSISGITGTVSDGASVTGATSGATATAVHVSASSSQVLLKNISGTFQNGEQVQVDGSNYVTLSDAGNPVILTARIEGTWTSADSSASGLYIDATTTADRYVHVYATGTARHSGVWSDSAYRLVINGWDAAMELKSGHVRVDGFQIRKDNVNSSDPIMHGVYSGGEYYVSNMLLERTTGSNTGSGLSFKDSQTVYVYNNIIYGSSLTQGVTDSWEPSSTVYMYNNTVVGGTNCYHAPVSTFVAINNIAQDCTGDDFSGSYHASSSNNLSSDSTAPGSNPVISTTLTFVNKASDDYHLAAADSGARDAGLDLSTDPNYAFLSDIDGDARSAGAAWDIGADELSGAMPTQIHYRWRYDDGYEGNWDIDTIDDGAGTDVGEYTSIDTVGSDNIYITYRISGSLDDLGFARSTDGGNTWTTSTIDTNGGIGSYSSIDAVDTNTLYVSYYHTGSELGFAKSLDGGDTWTTSSIDATDSAGYYTSIHALSSSTIFISYMRRQTTESGYQIRLAKSINNGSTWNTYLIDGPAASSTGAWSDLHVVDANNMFVSYQGPFTTTSTDVRFGRSSDGGVTWTTSTIATIDGTYLSIYSSLYAPTTNDIYVSYHHADPVWELRLARSTDGGLNFTTSTVDDTTSNQGKFTSIGGIGTSTLYISYQDESGDDLRVARSDNGGSNWTLSTVNTEIGSDESGQYTSIAVVSTSSVYVAYHQSTPYDDLKIAKLIDLDTAQSPGANWAADEDVSITGLGKQDPRRLRFEVSNEGTENSSAVQYRLEYATSTSGTWTAVGAPTSTTAHWVWSDSTYITDGEESSNVIIGLTDENTSFVAGELKDAGNQTSGITLTSSQFTEIAYTILATSTAIDGQTYYFRLTDAGTVLDAYTVYASATLTGVASIDQIHYRWRSDSLFMQPDPQLHFPDGTSSGDDYFGTSIAAGDINGDGYEDLVVGATGVDDTGYSNGGVFVYFGSASGITNNADVTLLHPGGETSASMGTSLAVGDLNNDGFADVVTGARRSDASGTDNGAVYVFWGAAGTSMATSVGKTIAYPEGGAETGADFGYTVEVADFNGDGYGDIIVGAEKSDASGTDNGAAYLYWGAAGTSMATSPGKSFYETQAATSSWFGHYVAAGDMNNDGYDDLLITGTHYTGWYDGHVYLYYGASGTTMDTVVDQEFDEGSANSGFGTKLTSGDVNGDGYADAVIGADIDYNSGKNGSVYIYHGAAGTSMDATYDTRLISAETADGIANGLGNDVAVGDFNGDGYDDVIAGAIRTSVIDNSEGGSAYLYFGAAGSSMATSTDLMFYYNYSDNAWFGKEIATGDFNNDGFVDVGIGAFNATVRAYRDGTAFVYMGGANWLADEDTSITTVKKGEINRLRFEVTNSGYQASTVDVTLQYATSTSGPWTTVTSGGTDWVMADSAHITNNDPTENLLTAENTTFTAGAYMDTTSSYSSVTIEADEFTEYEFAIMATSSAVHNQIYYFRLQKDGGSMDQYVLYASATLAAELIQSHYQWYRDADQITPTSTIALEDTTGYSGDVNVRLRISLYASGSALATGKQFKLQYSTSTTGGWADVATISASGDVWRGENNASVVDGATLPSVLLSNSDTAMTYEESNISAGTPAALSIGADGEWDWALENNGADASTTYYFRMVYADGTELNSYDVYPALNPYDLVASTSTVTIEKSIGTNSRDFSTMQAWEDARGGDLTGRHILSVTGGSGNFQTGETVNGSGGCSGIYRAEDDAATNGSTMTLDDYAGTCANGDTLTGASSSATATFGSLSYSGGTIEKGVMYNDSIFTGSLLFDNSTTSDSQYMWLTVTSSDRHTGVASSGVMIRPSAIADGISIKTDNTLVEWVDIADWSTNSSNHSVDGINIEASNVRVNNVIVHDDGHGSDSNSDANGINMEDVSSASSTITNAIVYNIARSGITIHSACSGCYMYLYNSTVYNALVSDNAPDQYAGVYEREGTAMYAKNVISIIPNEAGPAFQNVQISDYQNGEYTNNLISSDASISGELGFTNIAASDLFVSVTPGSEDLHLKVGSFALDKGVDLGSLVSGDIDGDTRTDLWDIGADEAFTRPATTTTPGASTTITKTIGTNNRDFPTFQSWEMNRMGDLTTRHVLSVTGGSGVFARWEWVNGTGGCSGLYVPEDASSTNGSVMTLDYYSGTCSNGDTLTGSSSGATATFNALSSTGGTVEKGEAYNDSVFAGGVDFYNSRVDADHYFWLTVASSSRHLGVEGTGARIDQDGSTQDHVISIFNDYTHIEWLEITDWRVRMQGSHEGVSVGADNVLLENLMIYRDLDVQGTPNSDAINLSGMPDNGTITIRNCIIYEIARNAIRLGGDAPHAKNLTINVDNCSIYDTGNNDTAEGGIDIMDAGSVANIRNTISVNESAPNSDFSISGSSGSSGNNISNDTSAPGSNPQTNINSVDLFASLGGPIDLHLKYNAAAVDAGTSTPSADFTQDIDQETRPIGSAWDIGADEAVISGVHYRWYENEDSNTPTTPKANEDAAITQVASGDIVRLRLVATVTSSDLEGGTTLKLQYGTSTAGPWNDVGTTASTTIWKGYDNPSVSDGALIVADVFASTTHAGTYEESNNATVPSAFSVGSAPEWDWVLENNGATASTTYYFRLVGTDGVALGSYDRFPQLTTAPPSYFTQLHYRWRNDNGNETGATFMVAEDTGVSNVDRGSTALRLRLLVENTGGAASGNQFSLQYAQRAGTCAAIVSSSWVMVPDSASTEHWEMTLSSWFSDQASTTNVSTDGGVTDPASSTFVTGHMIESSTSTNAIALLADSFTELEYNIIATNNADAGTNYCFRVFDDELDSYSVYPEARIASGAASGTLTSATFDTGYDAAQLNSVRWEGYNPTGGTVAFQFAVSNASSGPWEFRGPSCTTSASDYYEPLTSDDPLGLDHNCHSGYRFFRYRMILESNATQTESPRVDAVYINWSP